ncbi:MAG: DotD/TraH family lipoprotein [Candidatus Competibacteraceae bacterium]|jgi:hypothetical protein|nr:DotD/TraH family lipoprotein [Candidatus Competibacteraceae bacterium]
MPHLLLFQCLQQLLSRPPLSGNILLITVLATVALNGCVTVPDAPPPEINPIEREIRRAASDARAALQMLAQVKSAEARTGLKLAQKEELVRAATHTPPGMEKPITLSNGFTGPVEVLLRMIASESGYRLEPIQGKPPLEAVIVEIPSGTYPAITILRDAAWQAAIMGVEVQVFDHRRRVRMAYHG